MNKERAEFEEDETTISLDYLYDSGWVKMTEILESQRDVLLRTLRVALRVCLKHWTGVSGDVTVKVVWRLTVVEKVFIV